MRDDLYGALKNALERGASMEQSIRSLVGAGYPETEVRDTARAMQSGSVMAAATKPLNPPRQSSFVSRLFTGSPPKVQPTPLPTQRPLASAPNPFITKQQPIPARKSPDTLTSFEVRTPRDKTTAWVIVFSVLLLLSVLALVASILFKDQLMSIFS